MGLGRDDATVQQQKLGPQRDMKLWARVRPANPQPPVSGMPPEVEAILYLRQTGAKYEIKNQQYVYF